MEQSGLPIEKITSVWVWVVMNVRPLLVPRRCLMNSLTLLKTSLSGMKKIITLIDAHVFLKLHICLF